MRRYCESRRPGQLLHAICGRRAGCRGCVAGHRGKVGTTGKRTCTPSLGRDADNCKACSRLVDRVGRDDLGPSSRCTRKDSGQVERRRYAMGYARRVYWVGCANAFLGSRRWWSRSRVGCRHWAVSCAIGRQGGVRGPISRAVRGGERRRVRGVHLGVRRSGRLEWADVVWKWVVLQGGGPSGVFLAP